MRSSGARRLLIVGLSLTIKYHSNTQTRPNKKIMPNAGRQPKDNANRPTIGPDTAPPSGEPALKIPIAVADSFREIQLLMILFPAALTGPSAIPKRTRTISIVHNPVTKPVKPQNTDHSNAAMRKTVFGPTLSLAQPPIKLNRAYPIKNALKIIPISAALNPNSFSIKGAVIDNAERSI